MDRSAGSAVLPSPPLHGLPLPSPCFSYSWSLSHPRPLTFPGHALGTVSDLRVRPQRRPCLLTSHHQLEPATATPRQPVSSSVFCQCSQGPRYTCTPARSHCLCGVASDLSPTAALTLTLPRKHHGSPVTPQGFAFPSPPTFSVLATWCHPQTPGDNRTAPPPSGPPHPPNPKALAPQGPTTSPCRGRFPGGWL